MSYPGHRIYNVTVLHLWCYRESFVIHPPLQWGPSPGYDLGLGLTVTGVPDMTQGPSSTPQLHGSVPWWEGGWVG